jgi:hypothetical protein
LDPLFSPVSALSRIDCYLYEFTNFNFKWVECVKIYPNLMTTVGAKHSGDNLWLKSLIFRPNASPFA